MRGEIEGEARKADALAPVVPRRREAGFTLIEMVIAFAILAVVLGALSGAFSGLIGGTVDARRYQVAVALAESKLDEISAAAPLRPGVSSGGFAGGYAWRGTVRPYRERDDRALERKPRLYEIEVVVSWGTIAPRRVALETLRLAAEGQGR